MSKEFLADLFRSRPQPPVTAQIQAMLDEARRQSGADLLHPRCHICGNGINFADGQAAAHMRLHQERA